MLLVLLLIRSQQLQIANCLLRLLADVAQQVAEVLGQSLDGGRVEQFAGVIEGQSQTPVAVFFAVQLQVELGFAAVPRQFFGEQPRQALERTEVALLVVEHDLEQPVFARLREGFEQLFERQVLMRLCAECRQACLGQQLGKRLARIDLRTQHLGVDEETDQPLSFQARTVGVGHANANVALPAVAIQQALPCCEQQHEGGRFVRLRGVADGCAEARVQPQAMPRCAVFLLGGAGVIGGEFQRRVLVAQLRLPVRQLPLALALRQPLALPVAVVGVLRGQRWQFSCRALTGGGVQARELVEQNIQRPTVGDDVVHRHQQLVIFVVEANQAHPEQRAFFRVESRMRLVFADLLCAGFALCRRHIAEVDHLQVELACRQHLLQGDAVALEEACAQGFVALDQLLETAAQRDLVEFAAQAQGTGNVVGAAVRIELPGDPQAVLCQRLRHRLAARQRGDCPLCADTGLLLLRHRSGECRQGWCFEQQTQVQLQREFFAHPGDHLRGRDRVTAEQEKMLVAVDLFEVQLFGPDLPDPRLQIRAAGWRGLGLGRRRREQRVAVEAAIGQTTAAGRALQFAAGCFRQCPRIEQDHHAWRLLIRLCHRLANGLDQGLRRKDFLHAAADFCSDTDALLALMIDGERGDAALAHHFHFVLDGLLDVLRIEVMTTHDQHVFQAPSDEQLAVAQKTQITGTQPGAAGVLDEGLGAGLGVAPVAVSDARPGGPHFADGVIRQFFQRIRFDDQHRVPRLADAAAHDRAAITRFGPVLRQGLIVDTQRWNAGAARRAGNEQCGFGQAVRGHETVSAETACGELFGEAFEAVEADRFGAGIRHAPAAKV